jgi:hypothetical protein
MIGLTAGLVVEGQTGKGILGQVIFHHLHFFLLNLYVKFNLLLFLNLYVKFGAILTFELSFCSGRPDARIYQSVQCSI